MKKVVREILVQISFADRYAEICNLHKEYSSCMNVTKNQMQEILLACNFDSEYDLKGKSFHMDYSFDTYQVRLAITYKYGFIECFYTLWGNEDRISGRFNSIASMQDEDFRAKVTHNFPVATSVTDLESILKNILNLHNEFIEQFSKKVQNA